MSQTVRYINHGSTWNLQIFSVHSSAAPSTNLSGITAEEPDWLLPILAAAKMGGWTMIPAILTETTPVCIVWFKLDADGAFINFIEKD